MDPVSNSVSFIAGFLVNKGLCTKAASVDLAHDILIGLTGEHGELVFYSQVDSAKEARAAALDHACELARQGALGLTSPAAIIAAADVFADFLVGRKADLRKSTPQD